MKKIVFAAIAFIGLAPMTMAQVPNYVPTSGLVGWWPFNGNANDESGFGNNGSIYGAVLSQDRYGNNNSAFRFNGLNQFIEVADNDSLDLSNKYSIALWVNLEDYSLNLNSTYPQRTMIGKPRQTNPTITTGWAFRAIEGVPYYSNNSLSYVSAFNTTGLNSGLGSSDSILLNQWSFLAFTYDSDSARLFKNGKLVNKMQVSFSLLNSPESLFFGKEHNSMETDARWFKGKLDDIGIWKRVLTAQEIKNLYHGGICFQSIAVTDTLFINTNITSFDPVRYQNSIKIYPNPTNDHITIDNGNIANLAGYQLKITNSLGQQVFQSGITQQQFYVNLSTWTGNGIYFVHIIDGQGNILDIKKIVLQ